MHLLKNTIIATLLTTALAVSGAAGSLILIGDDLVLESHSIDGSFGSLPSDFTEGSLSVIHDSLAASGINTNSVITVVPVETDQGLSLMFLVDSPGQTGSGNASVNFVSTAPDTLSMYVNDTDTDITGHIMGTSGTQTAFGLFNWNSSGEGDAFAWAGLTPGDEMAMLFSVIEGSNSTFPGLNSTNTFQFLTWGNGDWIVAEETSFNAGGVYAFTGMVLPAPGALALLSLAALGTRGRRRRS